MVSRLPADVECLLLLPFRATTEDAGFFERNAHEEISFLGHGPATQTLTVTKTNGGAIMYHAVGQNFDNTWYNVYLPATKSWVPRGTWKPQYKMTCTKG